MDSDQLWGSWPELSGIDGHGIGPIILVAFPSVFDTYRLTAFSKSEAGCCENCVDVFLATWTRTVWMDS